MKLRMAGLTDIGRKRDLNEDSLGVFQRDGLLLVCDGMGGHAAGDVASKVALETVQDFFGSKVEAEWGQLVSSLDPSLPEPARRLVAAIRLANRRIYNLAIDNPSRAGMGTTVVAATIAEDGSICIAHVGDSRAYRIGDGEIEQLTEDHSWVAELLEDREITAQEAKDFKAKNVITRALGTQGTVKIDLRVQPARDGASYLLCSDGLSGPVEDQLIRDTILSAEGNLDLAAERLITLANDAGGPDNITVGILQALEIPTERYEPPIIRTVPEEEAHLQEIEDETLKRFYARAVKTRPRALKAVPILVVVIGLMAGLAYFYQKSRKTGGGLPEVQAVQWVSLEIRTQPEGAEIFLNGERYPELTPAWVDSLKPGSKLKLRLQKDGYIAAEEMVELPSARASRSVHINLRPQVVVTISPIDTKRYGKASLFIDGKGYGDLSEIANRDLSISPGRHTFKIVDRGRTIFSTERSIASGSVVDIVPDEPDPSLRFVVTPSRR